VNGPKVEEKKITPEQEAQQIAEEALQQSGLRLLTHLLHMCARWLAVPGFKRSSPAPTHHTPLVVETLADDEWYTKGTNQKERPERTGTWAVRVEKVFTHYTSHKIHANDLWRVKHKDIIGDTSL
jgi:hypothetical protein